MRSFALLPTLPVAVCGVVRAELRSGARDARHRTAIATLLAAFQHIAILEPLWDLVGDHLAFLRTQGITVPVPDAVIATLGIESGIEVWTRDPHFPLMQRALQRLRLFQEPP